MTRYYCVAQYEREGLRFEFENRGWGGGKGGGIEDIIYMTIIHRRGWKLVQGSNAAAMPTRRYRRLTDGRNRLFRVSLLQLLLLLLLLIFFFFPLYVYPIHERFGTGPSSVVGIYIFTYRVHRVMFPSHTILLFSFVSVQISVVREISPSQTHHIE